MSAPVVVIVNPGSANGSLGKRWPDVQKTLRREMGAFDHMTTAGPGDATRLTRAALRAGAGTVVAIGGDGTLHEVANGFFEDGAAIAPDATLALIPFGTGGDFRKTANIPKDLAAAARVVAGGVHRSIDVGRLTYRRGHERHASIFINIASFGIGGVVDQIVNSSSKALGGRMTFFLATARATFRYKNRPVRLVFDGDEENAMTLTINSVAVANGRYFGGGMKIAPDASLDDGLFDIVAIGDMTKLEMLTSGGKVYSGRHLTLPKVVVRRAARLDAIPVHEGDEILLDVDGEQPGALPSTFELLPRAVKMVLPA